MFHSSSRVWLAASALSQSDDPFLAYLKHTSSGGSLVRACHRAPLAQARLFQRLMSCRKRQHLSVPKRPRAREMLRLISAHSGAHRHQELAARRAMDIAGLAATRTSRRMWVGSSGPL
jgi:hypothetical protein